MTTFHLTASANFVDVHAEVVDAETAREVAASFPKSLRMSGGSLSTFRGTPGEADYEPYQAGSVSMNADLRANGNKGERNEAGVKRVRSFIRNAEKLGHEVRFGPRRPSPHYTGPTSLEELDALLG